jgi:hypothetical protein
MLSEKPNTSPFGEGFLDSITQFPADEFTGNFAQGKLSG